MTRQRFLRNLVKVAILAAVYFVAGKLGLKLALVHPSATAVWAPAGIALAAFLILGYGVFPGVLLGAFLVNMTTAGSVATSIGIAVGNTLEGLLGAYLVNELANGRNAFGRAQDIFRFAVLAGIISTTVSATFGVTSLCLGGFANWADFGAIWLTWWLGDAVGVLVLAPLLVLWSASPPRNGTRIRPLRPRSCSWLCFWLLIRCSAACLPSELGIILWNSCAFRSWSGRHSGSDNA